MIREERLSNSLTRAVTSEKTRCFWACQMSGCISHAHTQFHFFSVSVKFEYLVSSSLDQNRCYLFLWCSRLDIFFFPFIFLFGSKNLVLCTLQTFSKWMTYFAKSRRDYRLRMPVTNKFANLLKSQFIEMCCSIVSLPTQLAYVFWPSSTCPALSLNNIQILRVQLAMAFILKMNE